MEDKKTRKKARKPAPDRLESGQGRRLAQFRLSFGNKYTSREAFAKEIGASETTILEIENNLRSISKKIEALLRNKFAKKDVDWIINNENEKLLTIKKSEEEVSEPSIEYKNICLECLRKDKTIDSLRQEINQWQKKYIDCLEEMAGLKKASSG